MKTKIELNKEISLYSTWWLIPGKEDEMIPILQELAKKVQNKEKGKTLMYEIHLPRYDFPGVSKCGIPIASEPKVRPGTVVFIEKYKDWEAFKAHLCGPVFTNFRDTYSSNFVLGNDGFPFTHVAFMNQVAGFSSTQG